MMKSRRNFVKHGLLALVLFANCAIATAQNGLFFAEMQGIYGYSSAMEKPIIYNFMPKDAMQKPSMGFDWLQRFSNSERDFAIMSLQFRLAYNISEQTPFEPQLYNAWLKYKSAVGDFAVGHLKPASGLSYTLDNHALILPDMTMYNLTYDRDWGALFSKDTAWGNLSASATNASGMNIYNKDGNYMLAARAAYGVLNEDNYSIGITAQKGVNLVAMGYHFHKLPGQTDPKLHPQMLAGIDGQFRYYNLESAIDVYAGDFLKTDAYSLLWRNGINILPEEKLKLEGQGIWRLFEGKHYVDYSAGLTFKLTSDLAFRAMYDWQDMTAGVENYKVIGQIYYYKQLF
jgi:hypothetical protein